METEATYQIFRKEPDNTTVLVEAVKGIEHAEERVGELNRCGPWEHYIFDPVKAAVIESSRPDVPVDPFAL